MRSRAHASALIKVALLCSRLGKAKVLFAPYSNDQIMEIVRERLAGLPPVFEPFAVKLAARKVSNVSGDVRRALEVLRMAAELADDAGDAARGGLVTSARVSAAYATMFEAAHMQVRPVALERFSYHAACEPR